MSVMMKKVKMNNVKGVTVNLLAVWYNVSSQNIDIMVSCFISTKLMYQLFDTDRYAERYSKNYKEEFDIIFLLDLFRYVNIFIHDGIDIIRCECKVSRHDEILVYKRLNFANEVAISTHVFSKDEIKNAVNLVHPERNNTDYIADIKILKED